VAFAALVGVSFALDFRFGVEAGRNFLTFSREMATIVPAAFVLIGLFEVWVPRHIVERHLGGESGLRAHLWSTILAGTTVGGLIVAFPVAFALRQKGARYAVIFSYLGTAGVVRVPMTLFEMSFLGVSFTLVRYAVALPLVIVSAELLGRALDRREFEMRSPENE
jgi:uncharacterized membrane protein YraQ (UPF0718 family)